MARIFNTYGPRMHPNDGRVVSNFIMQALANEPITIYGDGMQTRSFCYVDDLIDGFQRLMNSPDDVTGPVNLGNPAECTMLELAQTIIELCDSHSPIVQTPRPSDDPERRRPDIALASGLLGWQPKMPLRAGLMRTIDYFRQPRFHRFAADLPEHMLDEAMEAMPRTPSTYVAPDMSGSRKH